MTRDDFAAYEASLFVGVPSLVAMDALVRSKDARGIILMDGVTEITEENRPRAFIADRVFTPMLELRSTLALLDLSEDELAAAKRHAATCGAQAYSQPDPVPSSPHVKLSRLSLESLKTRARKTRYINEDTLAAVDDMEDGKGYLVKLLATIGAGDGDEPLDAGAENPEEGVPGATADDRHTQIMRVLAGVQSIAIDVSRTPTFRRRFNGVMGAVGSGEVHLRP